MRLVIVALLLVFATATHAAPKISVRPDRETGLYQTGETVVFTIDVSDEEAPPVDGTVQCRLTLDGVGDLRQTQVVLQAGKASVEATLDEPGIIRLDVSYTAGAVKAQGIGAAAISPEGIHTTEPPADVREWWDAEKAALAAIPMDARLSICEDRCSDEVDVSELIPDPDATNVIVTAGYYDAAYFARFVTCPIVVTVGLVDRTCPATSVYAACNAIPGKHKQIVVYPTMGHVVLKDWGQLINAAIKKSHIESPAEKRKKKNQGF